MRIIQHLLAGISFLARTLSIVVGTMFLVVLYMISVSDWARDDLKEGWLAWALGISVALGFLSFLANKTKCYIAK